ncbi:MAG: hypothetical protein ACLSG4_01660 [Anaerobutyricum sp.]
MQTKNNKEKKKKKKGRRKKEKKEKKKKGGRKKKKKKWDIGGVEGCGKVEGKGGSPEASEDGGGRLWEWLVIE